MSNEDQLPTVEELQSLSRRGMTAYACRNARRVQPLYEPLVRESRWTHIDAVENALAMAERFVSGGSPTVDATELRSAATMTAKAHSVAYTNHASAASAAIDSAVDAAACAAAAADPATAAYSAASSAAALSAAARSAARRDFTTLVCLKHSSAPELGEPIDLSDNGPLGPLWPNGEPDW